MQILRKQYVSFKDDTKMAMKHVKIRPCLFNFYETHVISC